MDYKHNLQCVWFRHDLRTIDNPALQAAIENQQPTFALFIYSESQWKKHNKAPIQIDLIKRRLVKLKKELEQLNIPLIVISSPLFSEIPAKITALFSELSVNALFANKEYEHDERLRDTQVCESLLNTNCSFFDAKCILPVGTIINRTQQPYKVFTPFKKAWKASFYQQQLHITKTGKSVLCDPKLIKKLSLNNDNSFAFSSSNESGSWPVSTKEIIDILRQFCRQKVSQYHNNRDYPEIQGTSQLSPYLAIGAISAKQCALRLHLEANYELNQGEDIWLDELIWREFYTHLLHFYPNLSKNQAFLSYDKYIKWDNNLDNFERWCKGETGFPIVDAAMKQLNTTGWMHNRLRMITASFLVKDLHIDWRWGEQYFMSKLIDGDFASNNGGWQWCASVGCDSSPYFRIFNPITQGKKFDTDCTFIKHWLPELKALSNKEIHHPNPAPLLKSDNYPDQIVDHAQQRIKVIEVYKQAKQLDIAS
ncbi:deoxyribodipyrimidine photo-lyase [Aliivibrio fischeri]|uniref:deoxyribodipyrimidine photo-lyase n=1 Tax=Aliivibrio fischeri TaxID=668 RepID=UPI00080DBE9F|nr:deoxyribodipyrimidine photo-lyase [Aliivibrio fischeri]OCH40759.1 deoxyribodipyrimidine photolyase [Aliivibrio fischeri]OED53326.1 deoxyribodipyrimidine photolyase [Aliivibrio fischeri]